MRYFLALMLVSVLTGCATTGSETIEKFPSGVSIVPASEMGDVLKVRHVATIVFGNRRADVPMPAWEMDKVAEQTAADLFRAASRFTLVRADASKARGQNGRISATGLASQAKADYVLVIGPAYYGDPFFGTNQEFSGYGIYQRSILMRESARDYLTMNVSLLDGKSGEIIGQAAGYSSSPKKQGWIPPESFDPGPITIDAESEKETRAAVMNMVRQLMSELLTKMSLLQGHK